MKTMPWLVLLLVLTLLGVSAGAAEPASGLRAATFDIDATPPIGYHMAYDPVVKHWDLGLRARGLVLLGAGDPIVLCAIDWIGIANGAHDAFCQGLAEAAGTTSDRVAVHTLHQHDAPACDFSTEALLRARNADLGRNDGTFARELLVRLKEAVAASLASAQPVTHVGLGTAQVNEVASNRRLLGPDGKVRATRYTACKDPAMQAEPEGTIDPLVSVISLWNQDQPVVVLSYYATHPQSYYRTGIPNPDFPGVARFLRQLAVPGALHIHFTGAGGNVGAGKYNDGAMVNRRLLAERLADGMRRAWQDTVREPLAPDMVAWQTIDVAIPPAKHLVMDDLENKYKHSEKPEEIDDAASKLAWLQRCVDGYRVPIPCLCLGRARVLHMPGELFVEYQLAAKAARPDLFVAMAAYGDYGMGYIGTAVAYEQGGYETGPDASLVSPGAEALLTNAIKVLLDVPAK